MELDLQSLFGLHVSVSRFQEKEKKGGNDKKMITLNDNINDNTHPVQRKMMTQK
jgi:hypothetical protein